jgi:hypothetical protein
MFCLRNIDMDLSKLLAALRVAVHTNHRRSGNWKAYGGLAIGLQLFHKCQICTGVWEVCAICLGRMGVNFVLHQNTKPMTETPFSSSLNPFPYAFSCQWSDQCPLQRSMTDAESDIAQQVKILSHYTPPCMSVSPHKLIGIPTITGIEFVKTKEIIRCEGMQRLTKVFTSCGVLISSYFDFTTFPSMG